MDQGKLRNKIANSGIEALIISPNGKQLASVRNFYGVPDGEEVLGLIDSTIFGSAKNGLAFTNRGIYWRNDFLTDSVFTHVTYAELAKKEVSSSKYDVYFSGGGAFSVAGSSVSSEDIVVLLKELQELERLDPQKETVREPKSKGATRSDGSGKVSVTDLQCYLATWEMKGIAMTPQGKKLAAAQAFYGMPSGEDVLALIDATVFGSAKNGMAVTPSGIYWNNDDARLTRFRSLSYEKLGETGIDTGWLCIKFEGGGIFDSSGSDVSSKNLLNFLRGLQGLAQGQPLLRVLDKHGGPKSPRKEGQGWWDKLKTTCEEATQAGRRIVMKKIDPWSMAAAKPSKKEEYTFAQANEAAMRLIRNSGALESDDPEMCQTNDAIVRIAFLLNEIDRKFKTAGVEDEILEKMLEDSSRKNLQIAQRLTDRNLYVGILGEFSCGKSTFINAMLEERFLIEDVLQGTTCSQTKIRYSDDENIRVTFNNDKYITMREENEKGLIEDADKKREFLRAMTAEEEKARDIQEVIWEAPIEVLQNGLCIVDTPGIGSQNPRHTKVAQIAAGDCDALLVLTNLDKPLSQELTDAVKTIAGEHAPNCIFIGTRKDQLPPRELNRMRRHFKKRLASHYGHEVQFEFVSAYKALEDLQAGGGDALDEFRSFRARIKQILESNRQYIQGRNAAALINEIAQGIVRKFEGKAVEFDKQVIEYEKMIVSEDASRWDTWGRDEQSSFKHACSSVKMEALEAAGSLAEKIGYAIKSRIDACDDTSELKKYLGEGISSTIELFSAAIKYFPEEHLLKPMQEICKERQKSYGKRFQKEYSKIEQIFGLPVVRAQAAGTNKGGNMNVSANRAGFNSLQEDMESEENIKIGGGMATAIGVSLLVPGVGWVVGGALTLLGGILGAGLLKSHDKRKAEAREKANESMYDFEKKLRANIDENFSALSADIGKQLGSFIEMQKLEYSSTIDKYNKMLAERKENIQAAKAYIHSSMPELKEIAEKMENQKQKEYFVFNDLEFGEET